MEEMTEPRMIRSQDVGELVTALSAAQGEIKPPKKGRTANVATKAGGSYSYSYADLADVVEAYRPALVKHGLAVTHTLRSRDGHPVLTTTLWHKSGQYIGSEYDITAYEKPQEQGSALTYAKRYAATSLLDIVAEDDDDGKRAQDAKPAEATANPDANAILDLAAELMQLKGGTIESIIKESSQYPDEKTGKLQFFEDPNDRAILRRPKWLAATRRRMEGELAKLTTAAEPGAKEGAGLLQ